LTSEHDILGEPLYFREAPEPTNILWENRHMSFWKQAQRKILVIVIITILLTGALIIFYLLKK
jgi:hypothetical protein